MLLNPVASSVRLCVLALSLVLVNAAVLAEAPAPTTEQGDASATPRTDEEIQALIDQQGKSSPDWWAEAKLNVPSNLDLPGTNPSKKWDPTRNLGQYIWSTINPNPNRWREGIRTLHHVLPRRKDHPKQLAEAMELLGKCYLRYERDYARSAFWYDKAQAAGRTNLQSTVALGECYYRLGNKPMAEALLRKAGLDRKAALPNIKLWAEMGETDLALKLCETMARSNPVVGYLAAGNIRRRLGQYDKAIACYEGALAAKANDRRNRRNRTRARQNLEAVKLVKALGDGELTDGVYESESNGYRGPVRVRVTIADGKIADVKVVKHREDVCYTAPVDVPAAIVRTQSIENVDAVSQATITSEAILSAAAEALSQATK